MTTVKGLSRRLIKAATVLAPADRKPWAEAMAAELDVLGDGEGALGWAWGAFCAALAWRLRAEALFMVLLISALPLTDWVSAHMFFYLSDQMPDGAWVAPFVLFDAAILVGACFGLALLRPRLAWNSAAMVAFVGPGGLVSWPHLSAKSYPQSSVLGSLGDWVEQGLSQPDRPELNHPHLHNWQLVVMVVGERLGPCVFGAAVGWAIIWALRRLHAPGSVRKAR